MLCVSNGLRPPSSTPAKLALAVFCWSMVSTLGFCFPFPELQYRMHQIRELKAENACTCNPCGLGAHGLHVSASESWGESPSPSPWLLGDPASWLTLACSCTPPPHPLPSALSCVSLPIKTPFILGEASSYASM